MNYDIAAIKRKMLVKYPFFGSVVSNVNYKENKDIATAGTDGKTIYYNPKYLNSISIDEQVFVFAHEVCHIAFNHILRSEGKNQYLWNIATDGIINAFLKKDGLKLANGVVDIPEATRYDAEQLYEKLLKEQQNQQQGQDSSNNENQQQGQNDVGHDTHSMWQEAVKEHKKNEEADKNKSFASKILDKLQGKKDEKQETSDLEKKQQELESIGEKEAFDKNREVKKQELEKLKQELLDEVSNFGNSTNSDLRTIGALGSSKPILDWRYVLREAVKYDVDWSYQNATIEDGVLTPHLEEQPIPETEIVLDTSGSINETLLRNFLRECKNILKHSRVKVGCFDTKFYGFTEIRTEQDIENMEFVGYGGTNFEVAVNAFSRRVENKIIFTDGQADMPNTAINAIWIVFGNRKIHPKGGRVINITGADLGRLYSCEIESDTKGRLR